jgi:hypothetical protein
MGKVEFSHSDSTLADRIITVAENQTTTSIGYYMIAIWSTEITEAIAGIYNALPRDTENILSAACKLWGRSAPRHPQPFRFDGGGRLIAIAGCRHCVEASCVRNFGNRGRSDGSASTHGG